MLSPKQMKILQWPYTGKTALICDGAVRSGKTSVMSLSFLLWAMGRFDQCNFGLCGKTVASAERNIIRPLQGITYFAQNGFVLDYTRSGHVLTVTRGGRSNRFYVFGGRDESSYMLIQGVTLAGVLFDEVALQPRSFVEQALARCSIEGSKFWFNCNPEGPEHWFYKNWIEGDKSQEKDATHLHFTMADNPSLSKEMLERYEKMFSGVFYQRYILGLWVVAEGLIYTMFNKDFHVVPAIPRPYDRYYISVDYGTANPCSMGLWGRANEAWYRMREYYFDSRKEGRQQTDEEYYAELEKLAGDLPIRGVIVDPSAASFLETIRRHGRFNDIKASNEVMAGIRDVATQLQLGWLFICEGCTDCIREFGLYRWDEKAAADRPIKENDHAMDDVRYFVHRVFAPDLFSF